MRSFAGEERRLALALDASTLGERWTVLSISVVIRGCAIPVAWKVIGAHAKGSWRPYWEELLDCLKGSVPADWQVVVLADRGLSARWLYTAIVACGWHPFLRLNLGVKARAQGEEEFDWISRWVPVPGAKWQGTVECFAQKKSRLTCTLLLQWEEGYEHPWAVITDLAPEEAKVAWYGLRAWIEAGENRCETRRLGLASEQDAGCWARRAVVASDGCGHGLDDRRGQSSRQPACAALSGAPAREAHRTQAQETSSDAAASSPVELSATRTTGAGSGLVQSRGLACGQAGARTLAGGHHASQESALACQTTRAAETTRAEKAAQGGSTSQSGGLASCLPKKPILERGEVLEQRSPH